MCAITLPLIAPTRAIPAWNDRPGIPTLERGNDLKIQLLLPRGNDLKIQLLLPRGNDFNPVIAPAWERTNHLTVQ